MTYHLEKITDDIEMNTAYAINKNQYKKSLDFYTALIKKVMTPHVIPKKILLVCPRYSSTLAMIEVLARHFDLCGIILKNSTKKNDATLQFLKSANYPVLDISKADMIALSPSTVEILEQAIGPGSSCVVLDHGGYFSLNSQALSILKPDLISGIAEYAINGENRYFNTSIDDRPFISVGRSTIKKNSDLASANSIMLITELYLQNQGIMLFGNDVRVGVIGHGTLGARIRSLLQERGVDHFLIHDLDPNKLGDIPLKNIAHSTAHLCQQCDILFCATGNYALTRDDLKFIKDGTIAFTVTSPDDELDLHTLKKDRIITLNTDRSHGDTVVYTIVETGHAWVLPFDGEAPNTQINFGLADASIHQPCAAHIVAAVRLMQGQLEHNPQYLSLEDEQLVKQLWDEYYQPSKTRDHATA